MPGKLFLVLYFFFLSTFSSASEFDGGIPIDTPIKDDLEKMLNIQYIKIVATEAINRGEVNRGCGGAGNQTFGPGSHLENATIVNYSDNKGAISLCEK